MRSSGARAGNGTDEIDFGRGRGKTVAPSFIIVFYLFREGKGVWDCTEFKKTCKKFPGMENYALLCSLKKIKQNINN